jgi:hypothetical protein
MPPSIRCSSCGAPGAGAYCGRCGTRRTSAASRGPGVSSRGPGVSSRRELVGWLVTAGMLALALGALAWPRSSSPPASPAPADAEITTGAPPDLSSMTPRERFDRLFNRVMQTAQAGDTASVAQFAPMAFAAYGMLDTVDADARYHAAVLHLHAGGDRDAALRLADSIAAAVPGHLFALLIQGSAAKSGGLPDELARVQRRFLSSWDAEMALGRPEYGHHRVMLDEFHTGALRARGQAQ